MVKWTKEQEIYALRSKKKGYSTGKIVKLMQKRFGIKRGYHSVYNKISALEEKGTLVPKLKNSQHMDRVTQEQVNFVHLCRHNGMDFRKIGLAFYEQFNRKVNLTQLRYIFYHKVPSDERLFSDTPAIRKEINKNTVRKKYSKKEISLIKSCKSAKEAEKLSKIINRTKSALNRQWYIVKEKETKNMNRNTKKTNPKDKAKPTVNKNIQSTQEDWNKFKDLDLLINFYNLSIDEAKARYGFSYEIIAGRLEHLINSDKPDNIALVMEATRVVKERKSQQPTETKPSRRQLRKERKLAKKKARQNKRVERMEKKLRN